MANKVILANTLDFVTIKLLSLIFDSKYTAVNTIKLKQILFCFHQLQLDSVWQMSLVVRKPVFGVSDQVRHKPGCAATKDG